MQIHDGISGMVALASYIAVSLPAHATSLPFEMAGVNGLFVALLVSIIATEAFVQLLGRNNGHSFFQMIQTWPHHNLSPR